MVAEDRGPERPSGAAPTTSGVGIQLNFERRADPPTVEEIAGALVLLL